MTPRDAQEEAESGESRPQSAAAGGRRGTPGWRGAETIFLTVLLVSGLAVLGMALAMADNRNAADSVAGASQQAVGGGSSSIFTPAHRTLLDAMKDYFDEYPAPVQPIAFNHKIHVAKGMKCLSCHAGAALGPQAGIPSVTFCMACHQVIAASNPEIQKLASYAAKGQDVPWQSVNWFYPAAHVRFWHAPHIRAGVDCTTCHGNVSQQTVAVRQSSLNMHFCLSCHREREVSVDCATCHD